ncbi:hypothetical protein HK099_002839 [Clydaea vesicula]|uniref:Uncharacterized protein n=1 Tax=Clydaea vesicula TaxID=447962 RepID=A0AAD5U2J1_9FUNG|nr:hypothetical protein HK099_002839 [Clydaea vesicula]
MSIIKAAATSSTLFALGDVFAQTLIEGNEIEKLDLKRTTNFFIIGGLWHGPWAVVSHVTGFISFLTVLDGGGLNDVTANHLPYLQTQQAFGLL